MSAPAGKTVLVTGANSGIGKDVARQLALRPETARIYLACRNQDRATTAKAELEAATGRRIFDIILMDVADPRSVRAGLAGIDGSLEALVMNAGGMGGKAPMDLTADGATYMFASNVLGHVVLLENLLAEDRLGEVAVFAGSEAARGVPQMRMKRPSFASTSADDLAAVIDGSYFADRKTNLGLAYGQVKYIGFAYPVPASLVVIGTGNYHLFGVLVGSAVAGIAPLVVSALTRQSTVTLNRPAHRHGPPAALSQRGACLPAPQSSHCRSQDTTTGGSASPSGYRWSSPYLSRPSWHVRMPMRLLPALPLGTGAGPLGAHHPVGRQEQSHGRSNRTKQFSR